VLKNKVQLVKWVSVIPRASSSALDWSTLSLFSRGRRDRITRAGRSFCGHKRRSRSRGGSFLAKENPPFSLFGCRRNVMVWSCGAREGVS